MKRRMLGLEVVLVLASLSAAASAETTVKLGSVVALTGPAAFLGQDEKAAQEIAVAKLNARGGIGGRNVELVVYDSESQTNLGIAAVRRLISQDKVDAIVSNGGTSGIDMATGPILNAARIPTISISGSADIVNPVKDKPWVFKSSLDDEQGFDRLADFFRKKGISKVALVYDTGGFGQAGADVVKRNAERYGWQTSFEPFTPSDTDLTPQLNRIKSSDAQAVIAWTSTPAGVIFVKQARQLGLSERMLVHGFGFISRKYLELAGEDAKGLLMISGKFVVGPDLPDDDPLKAPINELTNEFKSRYDREPAFYAAQAYDAVMLAAHAIAAGGVDKAKVRDVLENARGLIGIGGIFNFSSTRHSGLSKDDVVIVDFRDGRFRLADYK